MQQSQHWYVIDAKDQVLGRLSTKVARLLTGKDKPSYVPYMDSGDYVVVINAATVKTTGRKETQKLYHRHSGFPGGYKNEALKDLRARRPEEVIRKAVRGMVPRGRLGNQIIKKLYIYKDDQHPHTNAKPLAQKEKGSEIAG